MNRELLEARIKECKLSVTRISKELGIDPSTYYRKVAADGETFSVRQAKRLAELLNLTGKEAQEIFFK